MAEFTAPIPHPGMLDGQDQLGLLCKEVSVTTRTDDGFIVVAKQTWPQVQLVAKH